MKKILEILFPTKSEKEFIKQLDASANHRWNITGGDIFEASRNIKHRLRNAIPKQPKRKMMHFWRVFFQFNVVGIFLAVGLLILNYLQLGVTFNFQTFSTYGTIIPLLIVVAAWIFFISHMYSIDAVVESYLRRSEILPKVIHQIQQQLEEVRQNVIELQHQKTSFEDPSLEQIKELAMRRDRIIGCLLDEVHLRKFWSLIRDEKFKQLNEAITYEITKSQLLEAELKVLQNIKLDN